MPDDTMVATQYDPDLCRDLLNDGYEHANNQLITDQLSAAMIKIADLERLADLDARIKALPKDGHAKLEPTWHAPFDQNAPLGRVHVIGAGRRTPPTPPPVVLHADNLESLASIALSAPAGDWHARKGRGEVLSDADPPTDGYHGQLLAESCSPAVCAYMIAFQPRIVMSLLRRIRDLEELHAQQQPKLAAALKASGDIADPSRPE